MKTLKEMLSEARQVVPEEGPEQLQRRLKSGEPVVVIDVRDPDEYRDGHIEAATNISRGFLEFRVGTAVTNPSTPVVLDRKSTRLNSSHTVISYAVFCLKKKKKTKNNKFKKIQRYN